MIRAHLLRWRPRQPAQRTESTPRRLPSGAASQLDPSHRSSRVSPTGLSSPVGGRRDARAAAAVQPPPITFHGARWSSDELAAIAAGWLDFVRASVPPSAEMTAMLMSNHPQTVALFFALSSLALPLVVFPADARAWRSSPPLPDGTPVFVAPPLRAYAQATEAAGFSTFILPDPRPAARPGGLRVLPRVSGLRELHLGLDRACPSPCTSRRGAFSCRRRPSSERAGYARGIPSSASLPLSTHYGLGQALILPTVLGSPLGLVERFDPPLGLPPARVPHRIRTGPPRR